MIYKFAFVMVRKSAVSLTIFKLRSLWHTDHIRDQLKRRDSWNVIGIAQLSHILIDCQKYSK